MKKYVVFDCDGTLIDTASFKYALYPGIKALLEDLSGDCHLYVWTARDQLSTHRILKDLGVLSYFDAIYTATDVYPKPDPAGLAALVGAVAKHSVCVIGDSSFDILGAKSFGVLSLGAVWNKEAKSEILTDLGADFIVNDPALCSSIIRLNLKGDTHV